MAAIMTGPTEQGYPMGCTCGFPPRPDFRCPIHGTERFSPAKCFLPEKGMAETIEALASECPRTDGLLCAECGDKPCPDRFTTSTPVRDSAPPRFTEMEKRLDKARSNEAYKDEAVREALELVREGVNYINPGYLRRQTRKRLDTLEAAIGRGYTLIESALRWKRANLARTEACLHDDEIPVSYSLECLEAEEAFWLEVQKLEETK